MHRRHITTWVLVTLGALAASTATRAYAQEKPAPEPATREAAIEQMEAEKAQHLNPYVLSEGERVMNRVEDILTSGLTWRPYFESAYQGSGFPFGAAYRRYVSPYDLLDMRGSYTINGSKLAEAEFTAPNLFHRRGTLSILGGWREATEVGFYGIGQDTLTANRTTYDFRQPYVGATLRLMPTRRHWLVEGGTEWTEWDQHTGDASSSSSSSVETAYTPQTLPGLGADVRYVHSQGSVGFDWRPSTGYARRGGYYGVTVHDFTDTDHVFGFQQIDYEAIQHVPILREAWVLTLRGLAQTTYAKDDQQVPFFMLPSLGGGTTLRGYSSWRFRDRNSLLMQAEWRIMVNRFLDTAFFYDAGKVADRASQLDFTDLKHDVGVGFRFHGPTATVLRIDLAHSAEGTRLVFAAGHVF